MSVKKITSFGISYLDDAVGGLLLGDNVVWVLEPGTYFNSFLDYFLTAKRQDQFKTIYVSFDFPPDKIYSQYKKLFRQGDFILVDAFTFGKGKGDELFKSFYKRKSLKHNPSSVISIKNLTEPVELLNRINELQSEFKGGILCKYVFDSLTGMQGLWGEKDTLRFFSYICPKLFEVKALAYWSLVKEAHSRAFLANISNITQLVISLSFEKDSTCAVKFLKMEGRPSQLLSATHHYHFQNETLNFFNSEETTNMKKKPIIPKSQSKERDTEKKPLFLHTQDRITVGSRIRQFRLEQKVSQVKLAQTLNITPSALSQIENNLSLPSLQLFVNIARFFGKSLDDFIESNASPAKPRKRD